MSLDLPGALSIDGDDGDLRPSPSSPSSSSPLPRDPAVPDPSAAAVHLPDPASVILDPCSPHPLEVSACSEFFTVPPHPSKNAARYLVIRNTIIAEWNRIKPKYLLKSATRPLLKGHGDVHAISRVHSFLEDAGFINFGLDEDGERTRAKRRMDFLASINNITGGDKLASSLINDSLRNRKRKLDRVRNSNGEWIRKSDLVDGRTIMHDKDGKPLSDEEPATPAELAEQKKMMAKNAKYFADEELLKYDPALLKRKQRQLKRQYYYYGNDDEDDDNEFRLIPLERISPPFKVHVESNVQMIVDFHAHLAETEIIGLLGGTYDSAKRCLYVNDVFPCKSISTTIQCEMDPESEVKAHTYFASKDKSVVGWYHSHPTFDPNPSIRDIETQTDHQHLFMREGDGIEPFVGAIYSPYDTRIEGMMSKSEWMCVGGTMSKNGKYSKQTPKINQSHFLVKGLPYACDCVFEPSAGLSDSLLDRIFDLITEFKEYSFRIKLEQAFKDSMTRLDKIVGSLQIHAFSSVSLSGDVAAGMAAAEEFVRKMSTSNRRDKTPRLSQSPTPPDSAPWNTGSATPRSDDGEDSSEISDILDEGNTSPQAAVCPVRTTARGRLAAKKSFSLGSSDVRSPTLSKSPMGGARAFRLSLAIGAVIALDLTALIAVRVFVLIYEHAFILRGDQKELRNLMALSDTYERWRTAAGYLDAFMKHDEWKCQENEDGVYNSKIIRKTIKNLVVAREQDNIECLVKNLTDACKKNHGGCMNEALYSNTFDGTKVDIEEFFDQIEQGLMHLADTDKVTVDDKIKFFRNISRNFGRSALCLSGGASLAYYHLGVMKALFEENMLPDVITGTSGGSLLAALVCTRTDEELIADEIFVPSKVYTRFTMMADSWPTRIRRFLRQGYMFDPAQPFKDLESFTNGHLTFLEAYKRSGRMLCISVTPDEPNRVTPSKLLNFLTAPDVLVSSAICASCAVPGILPPIKLLVKTESGEVIPYKGSGKLWRDGSIRTDIPDMSMFNVNFQIVSQVNPHVTVFFYESQGSAGCPTPHRNGRGWRGGFIASSLCHLLDLDLKKWLRLCKDLKLLPPIGATDISDVFLQQFEGTVTILPANSNVLQDILYVLEDPTERRMEKYVRRGELKTYPKMGMIGHRMRIEKIMKEIRLELKKTKAAMYDGRKESFSSLADDVGDIDE
ncbi:hypothetical protein HDU84_003497 [Entophlyctis sp. JEL0112]|nr:hypothetical protein HDU84_003497 [Entophlyctis sp. JEL0112]